MTQYNAERNAQLAAKVVAAVAAVNAAINEAARAGLTSSLRMEKIGLVVGGGERPRESIEIAVEVSLRLA